MRRILTVVDHAHRHVAQLFDTPETRADGILEFIREGLSANEAVLLVLTPAHWDAVRRRSGEHGVDTSAAIASGVVTLRDAEATLRRLMRNDRPDWSAFDRTVGTLVRNLSATHGRVRAYGEMVDSLARSGEFQSAARLEELWNRLADREQFTLFCGYSAEHFGNPRDRAALDQICQLHSHVHSDPRDVLGSFLLRNEPPC